MLCFADGGRVLELQRHLCTAAHSCPSTVLRPPVRLACLHHVRRHCVCYFSGSCLQAQSCERVANTLWLILQDRSHCRRLELWKAASSDCQSGSLFGLFSTGRAQRDLISVCVVAGRLSNESQVPQPPVKAPSSSLTFL